MEEKESWRRKEGKLRKRIEELDGGEGGSRKEEEERKKEEEKEREKRDGKKERKRSKKDERKNSIVISGMKWGNEDLKKEVEK